MVKRKLPSIENRVECLTSEIQSLLVSVDEIKNNINRINNIQKESWERISNLENPKDLCCASEPQEIVDERNRMQRENDRITYDNNKILISDCHTLIDFLDKERFKRFKNRKYKENCRLIISYLRTAERELLEVQEKLKDKYNCL